MQVLGIDIGGSGIKGAPVDTDTGEFMAERVRIETPQPSLPDAVGDTVAELARQFDWHGPIGCTFPAIMKHGVAFSAANVDKSWIGTDAQALITQKTGCPTLVINDADAAGLAEISFGAGKGRMGVVMMLTFGTGIGSALFLDGKLVPNTEMGHLEIRGKQAEHRASARIREEKDLSWEEWAGRVDEYLKYVEFLFSPDLFIIGGGVSKKYDKFFPFLHLQTEIVPAFFRNDAGILGVAYAASQLKTE
jgi:polyphosphate glucokinase